MHESKTPPFSCPQPNGNFADPSNCQQYYLCADGQENLLVSEHSLSIQVYKRYTLAKTSLLMLMDYWLIAFRAAAHWLSNRTRQHAIFYRMCPHAQLLVSNLVISFHYQSYATTFRLHHHRLIDELSALFS